MARNFTIGDWKIRNWPITDWRIHHLARVCGFSGFGLWSVSGESGAESGEERLANRSRSATPAAEPQTEAHRSWRMPARDERAICGVEGASSRGGQGRRAARETQQTARWSRRIHDYAGIQMRPACLCVEEFPPDVFLCQAFARLQNHASGFRQVC